VTPPGPASADPALPAAPGRELLRFGPFELDLRNEELRKDGVLVKLQPQPFRVLALLATRAGTLVTREEVRREVWGEDTVVDFDKGLSFCLGQVRSALGDQADTPRFVQTLPRRGYRFVAPVERAGLRLVEGLPPAPRAPRPAGTRLPLVLLLTAVVAGSAVGAWWALQAPAAPPPRTMLAVLPFENLGGDAEEDYLSDGMTEEMISELARVQPERLGVISRTSAMLYKGARADVGAIGRELSVQYVLEGSVRRSGGRVRVVARVVQVADRTQVWGRTYDSDLKDLLGLQQEVARDTAAGIAAAFLRSPPDGGTGARARLWRMGQRLVARLASPGWTPAAAPRRAVRPEAYDAYLKGRYHLNKKTEDALRRAERCFREALEEDPAFAPAQAALAKTYLSMALEGGLLAADLAPRAEAAARTALALDPDLADAHVALANVLLHFRWDFAGAGSGFRRALQLEPGSATAHFWAAGYEATLGRHEEAIAHAVRAVELDPLSFHVRSDLGYFYLAAGRPDEAIRECRRTLELEPRFLPARRMLVTAYSDSGRLQEGRREAREEMVAAGASRSVLARFDRGPADLSLRVYWEWALESAACVGDRCPHLARAIAQARLDRRDEALSALEKARQERDPMLIYLQSMPDLKGLRGDPRFADLARKIGFPSLPPVSPGSDRPSPTTGRHPA
jgi:TolB-like protein/DNA-binding winged helix-turn-helix (wHTH) protein/Tfp pilus assembly protein PilF